MTETLRISPPGLFPNIEGNISGLTFENPENPVNPFTNPFSIPINAPVSGNGSSGSISTNIPTSGGSLGSGGNLGSAPNPFTSVQQNPFVISGAATVGSSSGNVPSSPFQQPFAPSPSPFQQPYAHSPSPYKQPIATSTNNYQTHKMDLC